MAPILDEDHQLDKLIQWVYQRGGVDCQYYKTNYLKRRLAIRMRATGAKTYREYNDILLSDEGEYQHLLDRLTIHVSHFFRDAIMYRAMEKSVLPELKKRSRLQVWSAGCANGEEPYSLAMLFHEYQRAGKPFNILATDIDEACLERARAGVYKETALVEVSPLFRERFFNAAGAGQWAVADALKAHVTFAPNDLTGSLPPGPFDLIMCRNVMIYFNSQLQLQLIKRFHERLAPGGFLVLGKTEVLLSERRHLFKVINLSERIYLRQDAAPDTDTVQ